MDNGGAKAERGYPGPTRGYWLHITSPKLWDFLLETPMNHRAKFASSFIPGTEIRIHTNTHKITKKNSNRYIETLPNGMCG